MSSTQVRVPTDGTLKKYGLVREEWLAILERQGGVCAACKKVPASGRLCTDHEHVPGWKKMPPEQRKLYVRGILCFWCNHHYLAARITVEKAQNIVVYLQEYRARILSAGTPKS